MGNPSPIEWRQLFIRDAIHRWLKEMGPGEQCMTEALKVYLPADPATCPKCPAEAEKVIKTINSLFGGSTVYDAEGSWISEKTGEVVKEKVKVVEAGHHCSKPPQREKFSEALMDFGVKTGQEMLFIGANNRFYLVKPGVVREVK